MKWIVAGFSAAMIMYLSLMAVHAGQWHCQRNGITIPDCHVCTEGSNAMTLREYYCSAQEERRQQLKLRKRIRDY